MYTNADSLLNKLNELEFFLKCQLYKPHIIAVTEAKPKQFSGQIRPSEFVWKTLINLPPALGFFCFLQ